MLNFIMEVPTVENVEPEKAFVLIGYGSRNSKGVKSYGRLKNRELDEDCSVITKTSMLQKKNLTVFYTLYVIMRIPTVGNVERENAFVLIGYGSCNSKQVTSYGYLKNRESGDDYSVITRTIMLKYDNQTVFYTKNFIMEIPTVENVNHENVGSDLTLEGGWIGLFKNS